MLAVLVEARCVGTEVVGGEEGLRGWMCRECARAGADSAPIVGQRHQYINLIVPCERVLLFCLLAGPVPQPTQGGQGGAGITALGPAPRLGRVAAIHRVDGLHLCFTEPVVPSLGTESNVGRDVAGVAAAGDDGDALLQRPL